jgi:hypothetical protein
VGAKNKFIDALDKVFVKLLTLLLLVCPVVWVGLGIDTVNHLVVLNERIDGILCELVGDLISQNHVDMNNVSLNMDELIVHDGLE